MSYSFVRNFVRLLVILIRAKGRKRNVRQKCKVNSKNFVKPTGVKPFFFLYENYAQNSKEINVKKWVGLIIDFCFFKIGLMILYLCLCFVITTLISRL